jgi:hypothetical protein
MGGTNAGLQTGTFTYITNSGNSNHYGIRNLLLGSGNAAHSGVSNEISGSGSGIHYGTENELTGTGTGTQYGVVNRITNTSAANRYGISNLFTGASNGIVYGLRSDIDVTGNGGMYGTYTDISATATGTGGKFGNYITISSTAGGTQYGVFSSVLKTGSYAGYFIGDVRIGNGDLLLAGNVLPTTNLIYNMGTAAIALNDIYADNFFNISDKRLKENIKPLNYGLAQINQLNAVQYNFISDQSKATRLGLLAQEIEQILPELVSTGSDAMQTKAVDYVGIIPVLIKATQEQQEIIDSQNIKIKSLEDRLNVIEEKLKK